MKMFLWCMIVLRCILLVICDTGSDDGIYQDCENVKLQTELMKMKEELSNRFQVVSELTSIHQLYRAIREELDNVKTENRKLKQEMEVIFNDTMMEKAKTDRNTEKLNELQGVNDELEMAQTVYKQSFDLFNRSIDYFKKDSSNLLNTAIENITTLLHVQLEENKRHRIFQEHLYKQLSVNLSTLLHHFESFKDIVIQENVKQQSMTNFTFEKIISDVESLNISVSQCLPKKEEYYPKDCSDIGNRISGVYKIYPSNNEGVHVYCNMEDGGWTVFQRRKNGKTDFYRDWISYREGFGNASDEYWLGNIYLYRLTQNRQCELKIDMTNWDNFTRDAVYSDFKIRSESGGFRLRIGNYSGNAGRDSLSYHNGQMFSTRDRDNDVNSNNCAVVYTGAWWYKNCHHSNLNGNYSARSDKGVRWYGYPSSDFMKDTVMQVKCN